MKRLIASPEFAGAAGEIAVIEELERLKVEALVFNDVTLRASRFLRHEGKPLMSAQIDTLVITEAGVFTIEVKNWSRQFADSGQGFSPYEQASRASHLVYDNLRKAGLRVKTRSIIATNGHLPEKGEEKVKVLPIHRLRGYIEYFPAAAEVNIGEVREVLGL